MPIVRRFYYAAKQRRRKQRRMDRIYDVRPILDAGRGYLANKSEQGNFYRVHILAHLHGACRAMLGNTPEYPKFFAETTDLFTEAWGPEHKGWDLCGNCLRVRQR